MNPQTRHDGKRAICFTNHSVFNLMALGSVTLKRCACKCFLEIARKQSKHLRVVQNHPWSKVIFRSPGIQKLNITCQVIITTFEQNTMAEDNEHKRWRRVSYVSTTTRHDDKMSYKMSLQNVTIYCHKKMFQNNQSKISSISHVCIYFPYGIRCECT